VHSDTYLKKGRETGKCEKGEFWPKNGEIGAKIKGRPLKSRKFWIFWKICCNML